MFCPSCGANNATDHRFCMDCGQPMPDAVMAAPAELPAQPQAPATPAPAAPQADRIAVHQTGEGDLVATGSYARIFDLLVQALRYSGFAVTEADPATGSILANSSMSLATWGENVRIQCVGTPEGSVQIRVSSTLKFGLIDWGKNRKNVQTIVRHFLGLASS